MSDKQQRTDEGALWDDVTVVDPDTDYVLQLRAENGRLIWTGTLTFAGWYGPAPTDTIFYVTLADGTVLARAQR